MSHSEPIFFSCPSCEARYKIVMTTIFGCPCCESKYNILMIESTPDVQRDKISCLKCDAAFPEISCLKCDAAFPAGEGRVFVKYFPAARSNGGI